MDRLHDLSTKAGQAAYQRDWRNRQKQKGPEYQERQRLLLNNWRASLDPNTKRDKYKNRDLKRFYNMTLAQYDAMVDAQGGLCAICQQPETKTRNGKVFELTVDHNHKTGEVRELLCNLCNRVLGLARDSSDILRRAADYLDKHEVPA